MDVLHHDCQPSPTLQARNRHTFQPLTLQVTEGCGRVLVIAVGVNSEWGKTMAMCQSEPGETPLQQQLEKMAGGIAKLGLGVAVVCFVVLMLR